MAEIDLAIVADFTQALKGVQEFSKKSSDSLQGVEKNFKELQDTAGQFSKNSAQSLGLFENAISAIKAGGIAALAIFTGAKIGQFFTSGVDAAKEQEKSIQKLNVALALAGDYSEKTSKHFQEFAGTLQDTTGFSDDAAIGLIALTKSFGATNEQAEKIVKTAVNLAPLLGTTVEGAVEALSKSLQGVKGQLGKVSNEVKNLSDEQLKGGKAIDIFSKRFDGAAESLHKNFEGAVEDAGNALEDLLKVQGAQITKNPAVISAFILIKDAIQAVTPFVTELKDDFIDLSSTIFNKLISAVVTSLRFFAEYAVVIDGVINVFSTLADAVKGVAEFLFNTFKSLANGLLKFGSAIASFVPDSISEKITSLGDTLKEAFDVGPVLKQALTLDSGLNKTGKSFTDAADATEKYLNSVKGAGQAALESTSFLKGLNDTAVKGTQDFEANAKAIEELKKSIEALKKELLKAQDERNPVLGFVREQDERLKIVQDGLDKQIIAEAEAQDLIAQIRLDAETKIVKEVDKIKKDGLEAEKKRQQDFLDDLKKRTTEALSSPVLTPDQASKITGGPQQGGFADQNAGAIGQVTGLINSALKGAQGATDLISSFAGTLADSILPGIGGAVGSIVGVLAQGPDKVKEMLDGFIKAIPDVLNGIAQSIPVVIETLADHAPEIIIALVKAVPAIIRALVKAGPEISKALALDIPRELTKALIEELRSQFTAAGIKEDLSESGSKFKNDVRDSAQVFKSESEKAGQDFSVQAKIFGGQISQASKDFGVAFTQFAQGFSDVMTNVGRDFSVALTTSVTGFTNGITTATTGFVEGISGLPGKIEGAILAIFDKINIKLPEFKFPPFPAFKFPALPSFSFPSLPAFKFPPLPTFKFPDFPELKLPKLDFNINLPEIRIPDFKIDIPGLKEIKAGGGNLVTQLGKAVGFAAQGGTIPPGFPNDSFHLFAKSGEHVLDTSLSDKLDRFIDSFSGQQQSQQPTRVVLQVGEKQLADVLLNINRQGFRTA